MEIYVTNRILSHSLRPNDVLLFCPPWRSERRQKTDIYTRLFYRIGFIREGDKESKNTEWAPLNVYRNSSLPNKELCIVNMPPQEYQVTYVDVLHVPTAKLKHFIHVPGSVVSGETNYTPFPELEDEQSFTATGENFNLANAALDARVSEGSTEHVMEKVKKSNQDSFDNLQPTVDGFYWKHPEHWNNVACRLTCFRPTDHVYMLTKAVLQIRDIVQLSFFETCRESDTVYEVFFHERLFSKHLNKRTLPRLSLVEMQSVAKNVNTLLTIKAVICGNMACQKYSHLDVSIEKQFQALPTLVFDPWLLFAQRAFVARTSCLFKFLQKFKNIEPEDEPIVFTLARGNTLTNIWSDMPLDIRRMKKGKEDIPIVNITSPIARYMKNYGLLGEYMESCGGISSTHAQNEHTTVVVLTRDLACIYIDTIPFLIKVWEWDRDKLEAKLREPISTLERLLARSHSY